MSQRVREEELPRLRRLSGQRGKYSRSRKFAFHPLWNYPRPASPPGAAAQIFGNAQLFAPGERADESRFVLRDFE